MIVGETLGSFRILGKLSEGGMGEGVTLGRRRRFVLAGCASLVLTSLASSSAAAQQPGDSSDRPSLSAVRIGSPPAIDGRLDDDAWRVSARIDRFVQQRPLDGAPATEQTEVFVGYDNQRLRHHLESHLRLRLQSGLLADRVRSAADRSQPALSNLLP